MSLQNECMRCHSNKKKFCDECHNYMAVKPYCWDCHIAAEGEGGGKIMSMDRRQFLKIAGISSILGFGASVASATHNVWVKGLDPPEVDRTRRR